MQQRCERGGEETRETGEGEQLQALVKRIQVYSSVLVNSRCLLMAT